MKLQASVQTVFIAAIALHQSGAILSASATTCASCTTCDNEARFSGSIMIKPISGACTSGRNAYVSSIAIDSPKEDSFTYHTYESAESSFYYADCSHDSSSLCYAVNTHECGKAQKLDPVVTITCSNLFTPCTIRYNIEFRCTSLLASAFSSSSADHVTAAWPSWVLAAVAAVGLGVAMLRSNGAQ